MLEIAETLDLEFSLGGIHIGTVPHNERFQVGHLPDVVAFEVHLSATIQHEFSKTEVLADYSHRVVFQSAAVH